jgi:hypothetical protein
VEATPARLSQEIVAARGMIERAAEKHGLKPQRLAADKSYGTGPFLSWLLDRQVEPHIPVLGRWPACSRSSPSSSGTSFAIA